MAKRKHARAMEKEVERLDAQKEARREAKLERRRVEGLGGAGT